MLLYPLSLVYRSLLTARRALYRAGILSAYRATCPVVIVGNITVGGNGKTPFTLWLAQWLLEQGFRPGIVLRGYRGNSRQWPILVTPDTSATLAGDEAVLLASTTRAPVVAGPDREQDCRMLLEHHDCNVILGDDGLQHLALQRDFEIALHDSVDGQGNGWCLPAGPLREPLSRLSRVDLVVPYGDLTNGIAPRVETARQLVDPAQRRPISAFAGQRILALSAIARPQRFFDGLAAHALDFERRTYTDHHPFAADDIPASHYDVILVTEKDAVKLKGMEDDRIWVIPLELLVAPALESQLERLLLPILHRKWSNSIS